MFNHGFTLVACTVAMTMIHETNATLVWRKEVPGMIEIHRCQRDSTGKLRR